MPTTARDRPAWFWNTVKRGEALVDAIGILLVANVKGQTTPADDYAGDSVITEFLSERELDDLIAHFEGAGLYCEVLLDEEGFLTWLATRRSTFPRPKVFVYNLAQNGTGPARHATVAGLCRLYHLPLLDSEAHALSVVQHKFHTAALLQAFGLPVARSWWFSQKGWWPDAPPDGLQLMAKPTYESASIGVNQNSVLTMAADIENRLLPITRAYRQPLTVQEFVPGFEIEVPVFESDGPRTIGAIGIAVDGRRNLAHTVLTYEHVFRDDYSFYNFAEENPLAAERATVLACSAFRGLGLNGVARVDFRVPAGQSPLIIEVEGKPHLTKHSGFSTALSAVGASGRDLAKFLVGAAAIRYGLSA